jgi:hypothetical protein
MFDLSKLKTEIILHASLHDCNMIAYDISWKFSGHRVPHFKNEIYILLFYVWVFSLHVGMWACLCWCLWRPEEDTGSPGSWVTDDCKWVLGLEPRSCERFTTVLNCWTISSSSSPLDSSESPRSLHNLIAFLLSLERWWWWWWLLFWNVLRPLYNMTYWFLIKLLENPHQFAWVVAILSSSI